RAASAAHAISSQVRWKRMARITNRGAYEQRNSETSTTRSEATSSQLRGFSIAVIVRLATVGSRRVCSQGERAASGSLDGRGAAEALCVSRELLDQHSGASAFVRRISSFCTYSDGFRPAYAVEARSAGNGRSTRS